MKPKTTPKDFFLWFGSMAALYVLIFSFINLLFAYIDFVFPDPLSYPPDPFNGSMRWDMAALVTLFPIFLVLMRLIRKDALAVSEKKDLWVRRWLIVITIFFAGAASAIDLIVLLSNFLGGDLTLPFFFKVATVLLVAGGMFFYCLAYLRGFWESHRAQAAMLGWATGILIAYAFAAGFIIMGTPWDVRLYRFDQQKVNDLQNIQYQVVNHWQQQQQLPASLADLSDSISGFTAPADSQIRMPYGYRVTGPLSFELCATFNKPSATSPLAADRTVSAMPVGSSYPKDALSRPDNWQHEAGQACFDRTIDPKRYPPLPSASVK